MPIVIFHTGIALFLLFLLLGKCSATGQVLLHESHTLGLSLPSTLLALLHGHLADQPRCHLEGLSVSIRNRAGILDRIWVGRLDRNDDKVHLANSTCRAARVIFGHLQVLRPADPEYSKRVNENWSQNCHLPAACIIEPRTSTDVAITLKIIQLFEIQFSVRSGGQNPNPGFGSIDQRGVLIDLRQFNGTKISSDRKTVTVGAGARWGDVYKYLDPYNVSAVGSRSPVPAVGGFLAGGGIPFIPSTTGFGCDNVKDFKVVLGNSSIVHANATLNSDLFFALKGGGSNYGIVTEYILHTSPLHKIWYSFAVYDQANYAEILSATAIAQNKMESDPGAHFIWVASNHTILLGLIYSKWSAPPDVFSPFYNLTPIASFIPTTNGTILTLSQSLNVLYSTTATREIFGFSHQIDLDFYKDTFKDYASLATFSKSSETDLSYTIQPIGKAAVEVGRRRGGNPLGIQPIEQTWFNSVAQFSKDSDAVPASQALHKLKTTMERAAEDRGLLLPFLFYNDASILEHQDPLKTYGPKNLAKLKMASTKYDPEGIFQRLRFAGFRLG